MLSILHNVCDQLIDCWIHDCIEELGYQQGVLC
jgi:hypothetical protein